MSNWTSGPWRVYRTDNAGGPYTEVRVGPHVTEGAKPGEGKSIAGIRMNRMGWPEIEANAELIALAPEMAEAILLYQHWLELDATVVGELQEKMRGLRDKLRAIGATNE